MPDILSLPLSTTVPSDAVFEMQLASGAARRVAGGTLTGSAGAPVTPQSYGAQADGTTNDAAAIQQAADEAAAQQVPLLFPPGTYRCDTGITLPSGSRLIGAPGAILDMSQASGGTGTLFTASSGTEATTTLSSAASAGATALEVVNATGIAAGSWVMVRGGTWASGVDKAEWALVAGVSGSTVNLATPLTLAYASGATVAKLTPTANFYIENLVAVGAYQGTQCFFSATRAMNIHLTRCRVRRMEHGLTILSHCRNARIEHCDASEVTAATGVVNIQTASSHVRVLGGVWADIALGVTVGGTRRCNDVLVDGVNVQDASGPLVDATAAADRLVVTRNIYDGRAAGTAAIRHRGGHVLVADNLLLGSVDNGVEINSSVTGADGTVSAIVKGNVLPTGGSGYGIYVGAAAGMTLRPVLVAGNLLGSWEHGVRVAASASSAAIQGLALAGNVVHDAGSTAMRIAAMVAGASARRIAITGNVLSQDPFAVDPVVGLYGTDSASVTDALVAGNVLRQGTAGVQAANSDHIFVVANALRDVSAPAVDISGANSAYLGNHLPGQPAHRWPIWAELPADAGTYVLAVTVPRGFRIVSATHQTNVGTATVAIQVNGASISGLGALSVSSTRTTTAATTPYTVAIGDTITAVVSSPAGGVASIRLALLCEHLA